MIVATWTWAKTVNLDCLSDAEQKRVQSFVNAQDRLLHAASFALRRAALSRKTGVPAETLQFEPKCAACGSSDHGAPRLSLPEHDGVTFSVSHRADAVLVAVGHDELVGADIERRLDPAVWDEIGPIVLNEHDDASLTPERHWTGKESALKCIGFGLAISPRAVTLRRNGANTARAYINHAGRAWELDIGWFEIDPQYTAAVASSVGSVVALVGP